MVDFESSRAVIVGINAYGNGVPALRSAVNDAQDLVKILEADHGYSVTPLLDRGATLAGLKRCFEDELPQQVGADDRVLVYFAGHGIAEDGDDGPTGYLLPQDARAEDRASWLGMEIFREWLGRLRCRHLLVILDCCFAGAFRWTKETRHIRVPVEVIHRERYERYIRNPAWQAIASAAYHQKALDTIAGEVLGRRRTVGDSTPNSPFAQVLFDGLKGEADLTGDGVIMAYELATFLRDRVSGTHEQMPSLWSLGKNDSGEFIFLLPKFDLDRLQPAPVLDAESNPYRGLSAYEENDAGLFFGRDKVVEDLAAVVQQQPLTMVLGASGTGKSSLVKAGLLSYPRKLAGDSGAADAEVASDAVLFGKDAAAGGVFHRLLMRPADAPTTPLRGLIMQLGKVGAAAPSAASSEGVTDETPAAAIAAFSAWFAADPQRHLFVVIDQFEELVTLCNNEVRAAFLEFLADLLDRERERMRVVLTLRSDFEPQFTDSALKRHLQATGGTGEARFLVPPLQHHEFREIIEKPASERVLFFEPPALVDRLITEVIQMPGALPLLSFALSELYLKYVARQTAAQQKGEIIDRAITEDDYRQLGGVVGALSKRATEEYDACDEAHRRTLRRVMLRMVATEGELARRRVPTDELIYPRPEETARAETVIDRLVDARLVVSGTADSAGGYVEPAHDALVRSWGKLLEWQREAAAELPLQRQLTEAAAEWTRRKRASGLLWTADPRLAQVRQQLNAPDSWLNTRETEFVDSSVSRKRWNAIARWGIAGVVLAGALAFSAVIWSVSQKEETANKTLRVVQRISNTGIPPQLSLLLSLHAASLGNDVQGGKRLDAIDMLQQQLRVTGGRPLLGHEKSQAATFSSDGRWLATGSDDGTVRLWSLTDIDHPVPLGRHSGAVHGLAFSRDGTWLVSGGADGELRFWRRTAEGASAGPVFSGGAYGAIKAFAISPNGDWLVFGTQNGNVCIWKLSATGPAEAPCDIGKQKVPVNRIQFSPNGRWLATAEVPGSTWNGEGRLWDLSADFPRREPKSLRQEEYEEGSLQAFAFNKDETRLAVAYGYHVNVWDLTQENPARHNVGHHDQWIKTVNFSPNGRWLATGSLDVKLWDLVKLWEESRAELREILLNGHSALVQSVVFSNDDRWLATAGDDAIAYLWDLSGPRTIPGKLLRGHDSPIKQVVFSPDSGHLVTLGEDHARLWTIPDSVAEPIVLRGHKGHVIAAALSHDGKWIASSGLEDHELLIWEVKDPRQPKHRLPLTSYAEAIAFSANGRWLAAAVHGERMVHLWSFPELSKIALEPQPATTGPLSLGFSPDSRWLVSGAWDAAGTLSIWDVSADSPSSTPRPPCRQGYPVRGLDFSRDGRYAATGEYGVRAHLWDLGLPILATVGDRSPMVGPRCRSRSVRTPGGQRLQIGTIRAGCGMRAPAPSQSWPPRYRSVPS